MKRVISLFFPFVLIGLIVGLILIWNVESSVRAGPPPPTPAPSVTPGPPQPIQEFTGPFLEKPLNKDTALKLAIDVDKDNAVWDEPWAGEALKGNSDRVTITRYPKCNYKKGEEAGPGVECGPVWVVRIKGHFRSIGFNGDNKIHEGIEYAFSERTGRLSRVQGGPWVDSK